MKERMERGKGRKSPVVAAIASLILPGAGQAYNREMIRALVFVLISVGLIIWFVMNLMSYQEAYAKITAIDNVHELAEQYASTQVKNMYAPAILYFCITLFSAYDAYIFAAYIQRTMGTITKEDD